MRIAASLLQYLLAATFFVMASVAYRYGGDAQRAAEAEAVRQGFPVGILARNGVDVRESRVEMLLPLAIALCLAILATLNLVGSDVGRVLTWIVQPIVLVGGGFVTGAQVFVARYVQSAFDRSGDPTLRGIDVRAIMRAATGAFPTGFRSLVVARFLLATVGSVLVIALLTLPLAGAGR
jgi:hypothetical protein